MVLAAAEGYRTAMREFAKQSLMAVWYALSGYRADLRPVPVAGQGETV